MRFTCALGVLAVGLAAVAPRAAAAQASRPVAVPIVGSPAAQQPPQVPAQPPTAPPPAARGERKLEMSFKDGTVTLVAQNVTVREILGEWQRKSGCQFVNADKLTGSTVSMEFAAGTPELTAIDALLRGVAGYMVGPRSDQGQSGSVCGAVYILATSKPTTSVGFTPNPSAPVAAPLMMPGSPDDEIPPVAGLPPMPPQIQPRPNQPLPGQPNPGQQTPGQPAAGQNAPAAQPPSGGFGPQTPTAPGAGRIGVPATPAPNGPGRGGGGGNEND